jgi:protein-disulfide isomerase
VSRTRVPDGLAADQDRRRHSDRRILVVVAAVVVLLVVAGGIGFQAWRANRQPVAAADPSATPTPAALVDGRPVVFGSPDAPVQLDLYLDFLCPHCADFESDYQPVLDAAVRDGRAAVRVHPLAFVAPASTPTANAFGCAVQAGYGQSYLRGLFANRDLDWRDDQLDTLFGQVSGAPAPASFSTCVRDRQAAGWIASIAAEADRRGVTSTPALYRGDTAVDLTTLTPEALTAQIEEAAS